jgi:predicted nucleic acid-binding protein
MKIFDATSLIAFLWEMDFPEGIESLSHRHDVVIPRAVANEITREASKAKLAQLVRGGAVLVRDCPASRVQVIREVNPQLGLGECEVLALREQMTSADQIYLVSDDRKARAKYPQYTWVWTEELLDYMSDRSLITSIKHRSLIERLTKSTFYSRSRRYGNGSSRLEHLH